MSDWTKQLPPAAQDYIAGRRLDEVECLVADHPRGVLTLDAIGDAIGTSAVSQDEIEALLSALESRGLQITAPPPGAAEKHLRVVVATARTLSTELGRRPSIDEIAARASLTHVEVHRALYLVRIMQR